MAASAVSLNFIILKRYGKQRRHLEFLLTWWLAR